VAFVALVFGPAPSSIAQDPKEIIAAQLRAQGYACDNPQSATRDQKASRPNETVWIVVCGNASYRATLVPNMAARVETLSNDNVDNDARD
jgi:hypothetical protein